MRPSSALLFALLIGAAGSSFAGKRITINCNSMDANCPTVSTSNVSAIPPTQTALADGGTVFIAPLLPPAPPIPPAPPVPPTPPTPPNPPEPPKVSLQVHAACADKTSGTEITWIIDKKSRISGTCIKRLEKMMFEVDSISIRN